MTRARTGSHSRTEPGAVHAYEVVDHGVEHEQYFQGCGVANTSWDDVAVGVGESPLAAYEDAVEALAQGGWEVDVLPERPRGLSSTGDLGQAAADDYEGGELQHYVCVYVRGIPTYRTRMSQQRRAGTVGPGQPGQRFTHGDVEIETTLHPIDLDGLDDTAIDAAIARFPATFGLRAFPGEVFKIDRRDSYISGGEIQLYTHIQRDGRWMAFAKGTPFELEREIVRLRGFDGLGAVSPRTRLGTRVRFEPNAASHMLYSERYGLPEVGEEGTVTYMPGFKPRTYMPGPGGGLLYVEWDVAGVLGVSPNDVEKV